ncbi:MAG: hypothetical protein COB53_13125 [Elusimicrobia bacterium]|nr:MAG: hypothetical protein COB53_13125 [Elusimicrobiota bacterium]
MELPRVASRQGSITSVEGNVEIPFPIRRVYYLFDIPGEAARGGHAHKKLEQLLVAVMGSFDILVDDGKRQKRFHLDRAYKGLYIPTMVWRTLDNFSSGGICLVLASELYDEGDYYRDYRRFLQASTPAR